MKQLECEECPYYWSDEDDVDNIWPYCHYRYNDGQAPCEELDHEYYAADLMCYDDEMELD